MPSGVVIGQGTLPPVLYYFVSSAAHTARWEDCARCGFFVRRDAAADGTDRDCAILGSLFHVPVCPELPFLTPTSI
jgi:hypothetical protein